MGEHATVHATMRIAVLGVAAAVQFGLCLRQLTAHQPTTLAVAAFVALALVTASCAVWVVRRKPLPLPVVVLGTVVTLAASACAAAVVAPGAHFHAPDWSFGLVGWHLLVLLLDRVPVLVAALVTHMVVSAAPFIADAPARAEIGTAGAVAIGAASLQLAVVMITRMLVRRTGQAMAVAAERDRLATRVLAAEQWDRTRRTLFAGQLGTTLPLLADLADGVLAPGDAATRRRCALAATQLRRLFAENDDVPDPLVHEVTACVDVAERRGVDVSLAVSGAAADVPADVRRALTGPVVATLSAARTRARVSVLRTDDDVRVAVFADTDTDVTAAATPPSALVEVECDAYGDHLRTEARWRRAKS